MFPGVYVNSAGNTVTYTQPPEEDGVISTMPYQPSIPSSSQCTTFTSAQLYSALGSVEAAPTSTASASNLPSSVGAAPTSSASRAPGAVNNAGSRISSTSGSNDTGAATSSAVLSGSAAALALIAAVAALL